MSDTDLSRCDAEIRAAEQMLRDGAPNEDLLYRWLADWRMERELILKAPFPWLSNTPKSDRVLVGMSVSSGMTVALDLVNRGILTIDEEGNIWRTAILNHGNWKPIDKRRAENVGGKGYLRLTLTGPDGEQVQVMAHRVVWAVANKAIPPDELQINHDDLNKQNNRPSNLILCTGAANIQHSYANGRTKPWSNVGASGEWRAGKPLLSETDKQEIREQRKNGAALKVIARQFHISTTHVHRLCQ